MISVDLDEIADVNRRHRLISIDRGNVFSLRQKDFLPLTEPLHNATTPPKRNHYGYAATDRPTLKERVIRYLNHHGIAADDTVRVELVTLPRMLGYRFNPVSFYYIRTADGRLVAAITEVTNTFHEMKPFLLTGDMLQGNQFHRRTAKNFYVSPFSEVDIDFDFRLRPAADRLAVQIDDYEGERRNLATSITGPARPLTDRALAWFLIKYPLLTVRVIFLIHWHAMRLWFKRVPWFAKQKQPEAQSDLYRPHASLPSDPTANAPLARPRHS